MFVVVHLRRVDEVQVELKKIGESEMVGYLFVVTTERHTGLVPHIASLKVDVTEWESMGEAQ